MNLDSHFRTKSKFYDKVHYAKIEREVEDIYNEFLLKQYKDVQIKYPYACDGLIVKDNLKLIMEYKYNYNFNNKVDQARVIVQVLFYLKRFENAGEIIPNVILIGDKNECFVMHTNEIIKYLDKTDIDWKIAPSGAAEKNSDLILELANDESFNPFVYRIDENMQFDSVLEKISDLADNVKRYVHITEHNISNIYDYFCKNVISDMKKISANNIVSVFIGCITDDDSFYMHPKKKGVLITPHGDVRVNDRNFKAFFSHYARKYTPEEKNKFAEISDRLIEDTNRRNKGEFYTPTLFVDYAHTMISEALGEDWKSEYIVWDNCCGTKNLTRDYRFKELYCSTLEEAELEIGKKYSPEATSFQYDFLNDDLEKLPKGLLDAFEQNKKIVCFLNPPYGAPGYNDDNGKGVGGVSAGIANTKISSEMKNNKIGRCSSNLYTQFLYRIYNIKKLYNLTNCYIGIFSPKSFLTSSSYKVFRNIFLNNFSFIDGCQFQASHFANVSSAWAISFSIWKDGNCNNKAEFIYKTIDNIDGKINILNHNTIVYNIDGKKPLNDYIKDNKNKNMIEFLQCGALMKITGICKMPNDSLAGYYSHGNDFMHNTSFVNIMPTGKSINSENFNQVCTVIGTRKLIDVNWENNKNEHILPEYITNEYINDCIIFTLFNGSVYNYSLRNINYYDKLWDIKNEFFWMSKSEIESLANENGNDDCYNDAHTAPERFVYNKLQEITLTPEAQAVLDKASDIVRKTFKYRLLFDSEHPEYQINNWDCGFYQIKALAKEYAKDDLEEFKQLYKALADKMRPMVYQLGFLK